MLNLILALLIAAGLYLVWDALTTNQQRHLAAASEEQAPIDNDLEEFLPERGFLFKLASKAGLEPGQIRQALLWSGPGATAGALISVWLWNWPVMVPVSAGAGAIAPLWIVAGRQSRRKLEFQEALAAASDTLRTLLQFGGLGINSALGALAERGPERLRGEFGLIYQDAGIYGLETALRLAQQRLDDAQFDLVAMSLITADRAGSSVGTVLENLARTIRANLSVTRQVQAEQVKNTLSAAIIALMPLAILTFLKLSSSDYTDPYETPFGQFVLLLGLILMVLGYFTMRWLARIPGERRTLR